MEERRKTIEVGYGIGKGNDSFSTGAEAARKAISSIKENSISVVIVFSSVYYDLEDLLKGIYSVVGDVPVIGTTTAGEIFNGTQKESVVIAALASQFIKVRLGLGQGVSKDWKHALTQAISATEIQPVFSSRNSSYWQKLTQQGKSTFALLYSPGNTRHANSFSYEILEELKRLSNGTFPIFGGSSADDWRMESNYVFLGQRAYPDSILLAVFETHLRFGIGLTHGLYPSSKKAYVTKVIGHEVLELDGLPADGIYAKMLGTSREALEGKHLTLTTGKPVGFPDPYGQYRINVASYFTPQGGVRFSQPVSEGNLLTIMKVDQDNMIAAGQEALRKALLRGDITEPAVTFVFSCALRTRILNERTADEISSMKELLPDVPMVGFYSFGEQGLADDGVNRHNNEVITTLVIGQELSHSAQVAMENKRLIKELKVQIDERNSAEKALRESHQIIEGIVNAVPVRIFWKDQNLVYLGCNMLFANDAGYADPKDIIGKDDYQMVWRDQAELYRRDDRQVIESGISKLLIEEPQTTPEGKTITLLTSKIPLRSSMGEINGVLGTYMDITDLKLAEKEKKKLEAQLQQSQKMESIGLLAGGIAHDFNNILGIILGNTELVMDDVPEWNPARLNLREIKTACLRAKDVVQQILSFARKTVQERKPVDINPIVSGALKLLRSSIPTSIEIHTDIPRDPTIVLADPTQINQIMINLCTNATHAMEEDGGILEIILDSMTLDEPKAQSYKLSPGRYAKLTVSDTGHGIAPEIKARIFDPYFTTREVGKGSGMGLAVIHGIVMNHDGAITVDSEVGKSSTFNVFLPIIRREPIPEITIHEDLPTGKERVLFVDDNESIVNIGRQRLERLGYQVDSTTSPLEALKLFRSKPDQFDLLITDLTMPKMTGNKLVKEILNIRPGMPIIICTGFSEKMNEEKAREIGVAGYLKKPHEKHDLAKMVRKVLDEKNN